MISTERVARVVYLFCRGRRLYTREVMALTGLTRQGAWAMLTKIGRVLPLCGPEVGEPGEWYIPEEEDFWALYENGAQSNNG